MITHYYIKQTHIFKNNLFVKDVAIIYIEGPFCGYESIQGMKLATEHDELIFVLYSNPSGHFRNDGKLRALVFVNETGK